MRVGGFHFIRLEKRGFDRENCREFKCRKAILNFEFPPGCKRSPTDSGRENKF